MTPIDASAVAELVKRLRSVPDQFRAVPTSLTMNTSGVIYTASTGQFTPHPVAIEAATLIEQQAARLQELERDAAAGRQLWQEILNDDTAWGESQDMFIRLGLLAPVDMTLETSPPMCRNCDGDCDVCYRPTGLLIDAATGKEKT